MENNYGYGHRLGIRTPNEPIVVAAPKDENTDLRRALLRDGGHLLASIPFESQLEGQLHLAQRGKCSVAVAKISHRRHAFSTVTKWIVKLVVNGTQLQAEAGELLDAVSRASDLLQEEVDHNYLKW
jgi:hypothetical protein